jgi:deoxyribodipyrimidine photolyase-related protein
MSGKILRLLLGDQLNEQHSWFNKTDPSVTYLMMEVEQETKYITHHIQKIAGFFAAMRAFSEKMQNKGHTFIYLKLDDPLNTQDFEQNICKLIKKNRFNSFSYLYPDEFRLDQQFKKIAQKLEIPFTVCDTEHFLSKRFDVRDFFRGKKHYLMESFYHHMRTQYDILIENGKPAGGKWNFDSLNRQRYDNMLPIPVPLLFSNNVEEIVRLIICRKIPFFGEIDSSNFIWPVTREQSIKLMEYFCTQLLPHFGTYQDAMVKEQWAMFHSRLSFALNTKMLSPKEVIQRVLLQWKTDPDRIALNQVEGFIRQILGWREYMRGIYWALMPDFSGMNFFNHTSPLPQYYWDRNTHMFCMRSAIGQSLDFAYAHHIQRLMITGNFALLAGIHPDEVDRWYLGIYIDAIEWVEITNTRGMSQYADGGIVATKPYVSSAHYINKMSDYCKNCFYDNKKTTGEKSCPFNSLYWHFFHRNQNKLKNNPRVSIMYRVWNKKKNTVKKKILDQAELYLSELNKL